eukprot:GILJ01005794.1.p1 GENE.GILJ01005794.1~~GILJ01005794.1.p1  ORF type:complete len:147 (-),score=37.02 GILJ01005794.1:105-506(-)
MTKESTPDVTTETKPLGAKLRGKPKSGKSWKEPKKRFSSLVATPRIRDSWEAKQRKKQQHVAVKKLENEIKEKKQAAIEEQKRRAEQRKKQKEANELKSTQFQVIKKTEKLKKWSKKARKQLMKMPNSMIPSM